MKRREFIAALSGAAAWPSLAFTQQPGRVRRVGALLFGAPPSQNFELIRELEGLGYVEGRNIAYTISGADSDVDRLPQLARELVATRPEVIVGSTTQVAFALMAVTRDIPVVMMVVGDPVAIGLTVSLSRPSRNVTGFTQSSASIAAKRLEILLELVPDCARWAICGRRQIRS